MIENRVYKNYIDIEIQIQSQTAEADLLSEQLKRIDDEIEMEVRIEKIIDRA